MSPGLFALLIKPLATALTASLEVRGIQIGSLTEKTALYVDDTVLFLRDSDTPLLAALSILNLFALFSGLKVNWGKSQIRPLKIPSPTS